MDMQAPSSEGHYQVKLGVVEKWIVGICASIVIWVGYSTVNAQSTAATKLNSFELRLVQIEGKVDVTNAQTSDLASLRADVLTLKLQMESVKKDQEQLNRKFTP